MLEKLRNLAAKFFSLAQREVDVIDELHGEVRAAVDRMNAKDPGLQPLLQQAHAYAVFPSVGKASLVVGGAFGKGEVIQGGRVVGYAALAQLTLGVQLGGQTFSEIIAFQDAAALDRFKRGRYAVAANASAVLVKAGAASSANYQRGVIVFVSSEGGMMLELAVGGQRFWFRPAVLGRTKKAPTRKTSRSMPKKTRRSAASELKRTRRRNRAGQL
jgi:lipid-binding SYLF domain-containing protein